VVSLSLNLSAIAKGYGVDRVADYLSGAGFTNFLVEIGGEIAARGVNLKNSPWRIGVATPQTQLGIQTVVPLSDLAMATSGDYRNFFKAEGRRYSHTIDPRTGRPVDHQLASVTVVHKSCTQADAWATALHVLGPEKAYMLAEKEGLKVLFIIRSKDDFVERKTPAFGELVNKKSS
jgi:thiamine biosynthesis lipoprotein